MDKFLDCNGNEVKWFVHSTNDGAEIGLNEKYINESEKTEILNKIFDVLSK